MRSRTVGAGVLQGRVDIPAPPARLTADWQRETSTELQLEPGDVEALSLARARARWPDYRLCVQLLADWTGTMGLPDVLGSCHIALMACRGARYHHDGERYGGAAFCNLFLSEDQGLDMFFPVTGHRLPLARGTAVVFDAAQPHAVIRRGSSAYRSDDFTDGDDCIQRFLTWELPVTSAKLGQALRIDLDVDPSASLVQDGPQIRLNGAPVSVCPQTGRWRQTA